MAQNDYLLWAGGAGANVEPQASFAADPARTTGEATGKASSARANKLWRQASMWSVALATLVNNNGQDALDDGNPDNLVAALTTALSGLLTGIPGILPSTGDGKLTFKTVADPGWVMMVDGSIGNALSNATERANADTAALYTLLWNNVANTDAPVQDSTGNPVARGASAAADFGSNRRLVLPKQLGRAIVISGTGSGLTARSLGGAFGVESQTILQTHLPAYDLSITDPGHGHGVNDPEHSHNYNIASATGAGAAPIVGPPVSNQNTNVAATGISIQNSITGISVHSNGGGTPLPVVQASTAWNVMIKL